MDPRIKNALGAVGVLALILISVALFTGANAFSRSAPAYATIAVSGQAKSVGTPDVAEFSFSVLTQGGTDIAALQRQNTTKVNDAINYVKSQGVDAKDIATAGYDIEPRYQSYSCRPSTDSSGIPQPCPPSTIVGYSITQKVQVKVRDFAKVGDILAGVTSKGANSVSNLNFVVDNPSGLQNEARSKAIQDAKRQAEAMAKAGGFSLGRLIRVDEGGSDYMPLYKGGGLALEDSSRAQSSAPVAAPTIEPGSQEVSAFITLVYEIR